MIRKRVDKIQNSAEKKETEKLRKSDSIMNKIRKSFRSRRSPEKSEESAVSTRKPPKMIEKNRKTSTSKEGKGSIGRSSNASEKDVIKPVWKP